MARVVWTDQCLEDLDAILSFIARDVPRAAQLLGEQFLAAEERLEAFPLSGRVVPEACREDIREVVVQSYRLIYRVWPDEQVVELLTALHGSRRFPESVL